MKPGQLRHLVSIQRPPTTKDLQGGCTGDWIEIPHGAQWVGISPISGTRRYESAQILQGVTHEVTTRYVPDVDSNMRLVWGERVLQIKSLLNVDERNKELRILCQEMVA